MAPSNRNRRPNRPADEIMELNTGDVIPLFDEELEVLHDDEPKKSEIIPVLAPVSDRPKISPRPASRGAAPVRRPQKEAAKPEALETVVTTSLAAREGNVADPGYSEAFLYVEKGPGAGQLVPVLQGELVIGRASEAGLQLNHPSVSRKHATLVRRGEQYFIADAGSQNGTYVNWAKIRDEVEVYPGDQISIGSAALVMRGGLYTSAMRRGGAVGTAAIETPKSRKWMLGVGVFGAAVGIGVAAVVMFGTSSKPQPAAEPKALVAAKAEPVETKPAEVEAKPAESKPLESKALEVAPAEKIAEAKPVEAKPVAESKPLAVRDEPVRHERESRHEKKASKHERGGSKVAEADAAPADAAEAPQAVLKVYESGNLDAAIAAAEGAGATKLATRMKQFQAAYTAGKDALANKDGGGAVSNFNKALKLDEGIDSGWGKLNGEIRAQLAGLYVLAGNQAMDRGDSATATKAFKAAQGYQPANAEARAKLKELGGAGGGSAKPASSKAAADAAFDG